MNPDDRATSQAAYWAAEDILMARAWKQLRHAASLPPLLPEKTQPRIRFWDDAEGFACRWEPWTLTVFGSTFEQHSELVLREAVWKKSVDCQAVHRLIQDPKLLLSFEPAIQIRDVMIDPVEFEQVLRQGGSLLLPLISTQNALQVSDCAGSSGFEFFSYDEPPASLSVRWHDGTPSAWRSSMDWLSTVLSHLRGKFPA